MKSVKVEAKRFGVDEFKLIDIGTFTTDWGCLTFAKDSLDILHKSKAYEEVRITLF